MDPTEAFFQECLRMLLSGNIPQVLHPPPNVDIGRLRVMMNTYDTVNRSRGAARNTVSPKADIVKPGIQPNPNANANVNANVNAMPRDSSGPKPSPSPVSHSPNILSRPHTMSQSGVDTLPHIVPSPSQGHQPNHSSFQGVPQSAHTAPQRQPPSAPPPRMPTQYPQQFVLNPTSYPPNQQSTQPPHSRSNNMSPQNIETPAHANLNKPRMEHPQNPLSTASSASFQQQRYPNPPSAVNIHHATMSQRAMNPQQSTQQTSHTSHHQAPSQAATHQQSRPSQGGGDQATMNANRVAQQIAHNLAKNLPKEDIIALSELLQQQVEKLARRSVPTPNHEMDQNRLNHFPQPSQSSTSRNQPPQPTNQASGQAQQTSQSNQAIQMRQPYWPGALKPSPNPPTNQPGPPQPLHRTPSNPYPPSQQQLNHQVLHPSPYSLSPAPWFVPGRHPVQQNNSMPTGNSSASTTQARTQSEHVLHQVLRGPNSRPAPPAVQQPPISQEHLRSQFRNSTPQTMNPGYRNQVQIPAQPQPRPAPPPTQSNQPSTSHVSLDILRALGRQDLIDWALRDSLNPPNTDLNSDRLLASKPTPVVQNSAPVSVSPSASATAKAKATPPVAITPAPAPVVVQPNRKVEPPEDQIAVTTEVAPSHAGIKRKRTPSPQHDDSRRVVQKVEPSTTRSPSPVVSSAPLDKGKGKMVYAEDSTNLPFSPPSNKADGSFEQPGPSHSRSTPPHLLPLKPVDLPSTPGLTTSTRVQPTPQSNHSRKSLHLSHSSPVVGLGNEKPLFLPSDDSDDGKTPSLASLSTVTKSSSKRHPKPVGASPSTPSRVRRGRVESPSTPENIDISPSPNLALKNNQQPSKRFIDLTSKAYKEWYHKPRPQAYVLIVTPAKRSHKQTTETISASNEQIGPVSCKWGKCDAKLDSVDKLERHLYVRHSSQVNNSSTCFWNGCKRVFDDPMETFSHVIRSHAPQSSAQESHPTPTRSIKQIKAQYPVADRVPTFRLYWGRVLPGLVSPRDLEDFRLDQSIMQASFAAGSQKSTASSLVTPVKRRQHSKAPEVSLGSNHRRVLSPSSDGESSEDELLLKSSQHR